MPPCGACRQHQRRKQHRADGETPRQQLEHCRARRRGTGDDDRHRPGQRRAEQEGMADQRVARRPVDRPWAHQHDHAGEAEAGGDPATRRDALAQENQRQRHHPYRRRVGEDRGASGRHPGDRLMREREIQAKLADADRQQRGKVLAIAARAAGRAAPELPRSSRPDSTARPSANHNGVLPRLKAILVSGHALLSRITDAASWV